VVDVAWGPSFLVAMGTAFVISPHSLTFGFNIQTLTAILVTIWALRLSNSIGMRLVRTTEDKRYIELRKHWKGNLAFNTYVRIFTLQAVLVTVASTAVVCIGVSSTTQISVLGYLGAAIWSVGFLFEAIGDKQLKNHLQKADQRGKLLTTGVRRFTRHPSYFGESVMWWGIFVIALSTSYGWIAIITPVIITYLLLFVSGVPLAEASMRKKPGWHEYQRRTSVFFPLPPRE
jgi:steroid 5-alpha reductase family enzyme